MAWKLDDVDFSTYNITVLGAEGLLNAPPIIDDVHSWLDSNYSVAVRDNNLGMPTSPRQINLTCLMETDTVQEFKNSFGNFCGVLMSPGLRELLHPYSDYPLEVFVVNGVEMQNLSISDEEHQAGKFVVRLMVDGDPAYKQMLVYEQSTDTIREQLSMGKDAKLEQTLMGDDIYTFSVESNVLLKIQQSDSILLNGVRYVHLDQIDLIKYSTNKYLYKLKFWNQFSVLKNVLCKNLDNFTEFFYHTTLDSIVDLIVTNAEVAYPGLFVKGDILSVDPKNHHISDESCYALLSRLCEEEEIEFTFRSFVEESEMTYYYIDIAEKITNTVNISSDYGDLELAYGEGAGLYSLERELQNKDELVSKLWVYGGDKNLPLDYIGQKLYATNNPILPMVPPPWGTIEKVKNFPEIYPRGISFVESYRYIPEEVLTPAHYEYFGSGLDEAVWVNKVVKFPSNCVITDSQLGFDLNDPLYWLDTPPKLVFNTGELAGYEFVVNHFEFDGVEGGDIFFTPILDEQNREIPSSDSIRITPGAGDEYVLININPPDSWISDAVTELNEAGDLWFAANSTPKLVFKTTIDPKFIVELLEVHFYDLNTMQVGDSVVLTDAAYGISSDTYRIFNKTTQIYSGEITLALSTLEKRKNEGSFTSVHRRLEAIERSYEKMRMTSVEVVRTSTETVGNLKSAIIAPDDGNIKPEKIRHRSIDPVTTSDDASLEQWSLVDALIETQTGDDVNDVLVESGVLINHNLKALSRSNIQKLKDNVIEYDPTESWDIPAQTVTLPNNNGHFLYIKVAIT